MAGHSKWAGIKHKKAIVDARRGKLFTKLARAITVAAKDGGGDPDTNPALGLAVQKAKDASMPKDNIERAIAKGTGEGATPRRWRRSSTRATAGRRGPARGGHDRQPQPHGLRGPPPFSKHGGNLGEPGSVGYLFDKRGLIVVDAARYAEDDLLPAIEAGALDVAVDEDVFEILTEPGDLTAVRAALEEAGVELESSELSQVPKTRVPIDEDVATKLMRLIDALEDNDDVDDVHANFDVDAAVLERVAG